MVIVESNTLLYRACAIDDSDVLGKATDAENFAQQVLVILIYEVMSNFQLQNFKCDVVNCL
jgi:hypothetical protein